MKNNLKKRLLSFCIACMLIITTGAFFVNAQEISPRYNNVDSVNSTAGISSNGIITISNRFNADSELFTKATIITYIERKTLGLFWSKVDIGQENDEWVDIIYDNLYSGNHSYQLSKTGTYRVTVEYVFYGTGGVADNITKEIEVRY